MNKRDIISKNILSLRKKSGMTQADLADKLNYSDKAVSKWERGESLPDAEMLYNIATLFGVEIGYLFDEHDAVELPKEAEDELKSREMKARWIFALVVGSVILAVVGLGILSLWLVDAIPSKLIWVVFVSPVIPSVVLIVEIISGKRVLFPTVLSITLWSYIFTILSVINRNEARPGWDWLVLLGIALQAAIIIYPRVLKGVRTPKREKKNSDC